MCCLKIDLNVGLSWFSVLVLRKSGNTKRGTYKSYNTFKPGYNNNGICLLDYCALGRRKEMVCSVKVGTRDALLGRIWNAADVISTQRKLQRATRAVHNRAATCVAAGGGVFENLPHAQFSVI